MKETIVMVLSGMGLLIFAYLLFNNGSNVVKLLNSSFSGTDSTIKVLQGR